MYNTQFTPQVYPAQTAPQMDISAAFNQWLSIPRYLPTRLGALNFVTFSWDSNVDASQYDIIIESLDNAGSPFRKISPLQTRVELPMVQLDMNALIGAVPKSQNMPSYYAKLSRGAHYHINKLTDGCGIFAMNKCGPDRPNNL